MDERNTITTCINLCETGFMYDFRHYYKEIATLLEPFKGDKNIDQAIGLTRAGETTSSARFCYPHIADQLRDRLEAITSQ